ncbi:MAG: homocysteine S-methyltransferase family protein, partial [Myxococcales bacterium]|nr:homocysteine S-methyltransferase family protein [Myxococcales bacterium]
MSSIDRLTETMAQRIVVLDGAMGTMVQALSLGDEAAWRGELLKDHNTAVRGCYDVLVLSQPQAIEDVHYEFLRAGADIVETDTFTATSIALADFGLENHVREINVAAAQCALRAAARAERD